MEILELIINTAGGLALFMMAMAMMTDGLKVYAGSALKTILQHWTSNIFRAAMSGALITGFVQSSSAVTVATIGFVNAGILTLYQAIGVVFGANLGTTITGWLVSIVGFGINIETLAMPLLAVGVALNYIASGKGRRGLGQFLIAMGLFFLALSILKTTFSDVTEIFGNNILSSNNISSTWIFVLIGFILTALTQSSSAAIAIILTAASEGVIDINVAAAAVIGSNIGTTSTSAFAALNATANARRVALCHIAFNLITAIVALATLPLFVWGVAEIGSRIGIENHPAPFLALFHTAFNLLGIILLLPFARQISRISANLFLSQEEILSHPKYLDNTVSHAPELAIAALWSELERLYELSCELVLISLSEKRMTERKIEKRAEAIFSLGAAINEFATNLRMENLAREHSEELPATIKSARYLEEVARQTNNLYSLANSSQELKNEEITELLEEYLRVTTDTVRVFAKFEIEPDVGEKKLRALTDFQTSYQETKEGLLQVTIRKHLSIDQVDNLLDRLSRSRRLVEQLIKADRSIHQIRYPNVENIVQ